jgi:glycosyltransferase involved in cell wall biosynthesis
LNILISNSTDIFGGGEEYVLILATYLKRRGHRVWVSANPQHLLLEKCEAITIDTVPILYKGMSRVFKVASLLRREIRRHSINIVHSNANYDRTCAAIAAAFSSTHHVATVHSSHSIQHNLTHWLRNRIGTAHFIAVAESVKNVMVNEDNIPPARITVIPNGVENTSKEFQETARRRGREKLGVPQNVIVVGNVARLVQFKGHRFLLQAVAEVTKTSTDVLFPIFGDGELKGELMRQAEDLGIERYIRFMGFQDDMDGWYPAFDVYCHSSIELAAEAFPFAILRALANGVPVVCTDVGGIGSMVRNGVSGYLTRPEDPHALAVALLNTIGDANLRHSMGRASFDLFLTKFHASAMADKVEQVYLDVLHRRN